MDEKKPNLHSHWFKSNSYDWMRGIGVRRGVSKGVEDGCRPPVLQEDLPWNGPKAVSGKTPPQAVQWLGMSDPGETLGSPWPPLAIRAWIGWEERGGRWWGRGGWLYKGRRTMNEYLSAKGKFFFRKYPQDSNEIWEQRVMKGLRN